MRSRRTRRIRTLPSAAPAFGNVPRRARVIALDTRRQAVAVLGQRAMMCGMARAATLPIVLFVSLLVAGAGSGARSALTADCRMSQLAVTLGPYISEATEQHTLALRFVNRGTHVCVLYGHPRVTVYDMHGVIPFRIRHGGDQMISARPPNPGPRPARPRCVPRLEQERVRGRIVAPSHGAQDRDANRPRHRNRVFHIPAPYAFPIQGPRLLRET